MVGVQLPVILAIESDKTQHGWLQTQLVVLHSICQLEIQSNVIYPLARELGTPLNYLGSC